MQLSKRSLTQYVLGFGALAAAFGLGTVVAQQPMPPTKVTPLMKQAIPEYPGHEVAMITLDIPPGGGSGPHRHPGHRRRLGFSANGEHPVFHVIGNQPPVDRISAHKPDE